MVGQVCQVHVECCAVELFHHFANHAVEHLPLTHQELVVNGLLRHCVAEGELLCRLLDDELGADELLHQGEQLLLVVVCHLLQNGKIETTPGNRGEDQELPGRLTQMVAPLLHRILNAPGDVQHAQWLAIPGSTSEGDLSSRDQRFEEF